MNYVFNIAYGMYSVHCINRFSRHCPRLIPRVDVTIIFEITFGLPTTILVLPTAGVVTQHAAPSVKSTELSSMYMYTQ